MAGSRRRTKSDSSKAARPTFIDLSYPSPALLKLAGPIVPGAWTLPLHLEERYRRSDMPVPKPVSGFVLVDTGASDTCISLQAAEELGLLPRRMATTYGASGLARNPVFWARLVIEIQTVDGTTTAGLDDEVVSVPHLEDSIRALGVKVAAPRRSGAKAPVRLIGLLGRDLLRHATFLYEGARAHFRLTFDGASFQRPTARRR